MPCAFIGGFGSSLSIIQDWTWFFQQNIHKLSGFEGKMLGGKPVESLFDENSLVSGDCINVNHQPVTPKIVT